MNILLASVVTLPQLVNGKVCVLTDGGYNLYKPAKGVNITDYFDPTEYCILIHEKYPKCIIHSKTHEREQYLVNKQIKELKNKLTPYRVGDRIHIHSRQGMYEIVDIDKDTITITCNKWGYSDVPTHVVLKEDFKCLAGGRHNAVFP
jgi:hypothetical protein